MLRQLLILQYFTQETFAGKRHKNRQILNTQLLQIANKGNVVFRCLAEPDSGVQADALRSNSRCGSQSHPFLEKGANLCHHVEVMGGILHCARRALHMHQHNAAGQFRANLPHSGVCQAAYIIHHICPGQQRSARHRGMASIN